MLGYLCLSLSSSLKHLKDLKELGVIPGE